ncbi:MAG: PH domain-containing protein [Isosphaeraceae bacterium]
MTTDPFTDTQITTTDVDPSTASTPPDSSVPETSVPAAPAAQPAAAPAAQEVLGTPNEHQNQKSASDVDPAVDTEEDLWEARYSLRNFLGRLVGLGLFSLAWFGLWIYASQEPGGTNAGARTGLSILLWIAGLTLLVLWLAILRRIVLARFGHHYRLTNRRLFVSTGLFNRRRDQMELLQIKDVYLRQTFFQRLLSLGTVVVVSQEQHYPLMYLTGVDDPQAVMDMIWQQSRTERDNRSVHIDHV